MISEIVLRRGLGALGEAFNRKVDGATVRLWAHACRELSDDQFRYGLDVVLREERFFPPPSVVLGAGFGMPREQTAPPADRLLRGSDTFWKDGAQAQHVLNVVKANPITETERKGGTAGSMCYIRRIAIAAGLMAEDGLKPGRSMPEAPSREPGSDDE